MTDWHEGPVDDWPKKRRHLAPQGECKSCDAARENKAALEDAPYFAPPHDAHPRCESGGHDHCTCNVCF